MSGRAKVFVEFWISEFLRADMAEDEARGESRTNALACLKSAALNGIPTAEIEEEYADLVTYMAAQYDRIAEYAASPSLYSFH